MQENEQLIKVPLEDKEELNLIEKISDKSDNNSLINSNTSTNNDLDLCISKIKVRKKFL